MELTVRKLFSAGIATSTRKVYQSDTNRFFHFCSSIFVTPFLACEHTLSLFVAHLYADGLCSSTVNSYLSAVRYTQITGGFGDPRIAEMPQSEYMYVTKGLRKLTSKAAANKRLPITLIILNSCARFGTLTQFASMH